MDRRRFLRALGSELFLFPSGSAHNPPQLLSVCEETSLLAVGAPGAGAPGAGAPDGCAPIRCAATFHVSPDEQWGGASKASHADVRGPYAEDAMHICFATTDPGTGDGGAPNPNARQLDKSVLDVEGTQANDGRTLQWRFDSLPCGALNVANAVAVTATDAEGARCVARRNARTGACWSESALSWTVPASSHEQSVVVAHISIIFAQVTLNLFARDQYAFDVRGVMDQLSEQAKSDMINVASAHANNSSSMDVRRDQTSQMEKWLDKFEDNSHRGDRLPETLDELANAVCALTRSATQTGHT